MSAQVIDHDERPFTAFLRSNLPGFEKLVESGTAKAAHLYRCVDIDGYRLHRFLRFVASSAVAWDVGEICKPLETMANSAINIRANALQKPCGTM